MRLQYDPEVDALYIRLREGVVPAQTLRITEDLAVDLGPDGLPVGLELLNATRFLGPLPSPVPVEEVRR